MAITNITSEIIESILEDNSKVVLDFWAAWCGPCKTISPKIEVLSEKFPDVLFGKINIDEEPSLIKKYDIKSIPTLIAFCNMEECARRTGRASDEELQEFIINSVYSEGKASL